MYEQNEDDYYDDINQYDDEHDYDDAIQNGDGICFKFDVMNDACPSWFQKLMDDLNKDINLLHIDQSISGFPVVSLPVNSYFSNTVNGFDSVLYLGNNYQNQQIWKTKYFIKNELEIEYKNHIKNYPAYFVRQPAYYKGMFDILN